MPLNTYGHSLGLAANVYEDVYFISLVTVTQAPHVIFFLLLLSSLSGTLSPSRRGHGGRCRQRRLRACGQANEPLP